MTDHSGRAYFAPYCLLISAIRQFNNTTVPGSKQGIHGDRPECERDDWLEVIKLMVEGGAYVNSQGHGLESSPLVESVESSDTRVLEVLLKNGAHVNQKTHTALSKQPHVDSALSLACYMDNTEAFQLLIQYGANVNHISPCLLKYTLENGFYQCAKLVILAGYCVQPECKTFIDQLWSVHMQRSSMKNMFPYSIHSNSSDDNNMIRPLKEIWYFLHNPRPLIWMCRTTLRHKCQMYNMKVLDQLELPKSVRDYIQCCHH